MSYVFRKLLNVSGYFYRQGLLIGGKLDNIVSKCNLF